LVDGSQSGNIIFTHNALKSKDTIAVSGAGTSPMFSATPIILNFSSVRNRLSKIDSITVTNTGTANLIITSITRTNTLFTVTPTAGTITPGSSQKFYCMFAPIADGAQNGKIIFIHNAATLKDTITVSGIGVSSKFAVNPTNLNFGNVINGTTKLDSITVTNTGTADLIISSFASTNYHFIINALSATIAPNTSRKFFITFTPTVSGIEEGYIRFVFNATNAKDSIRVTGTGSGNPSFPQFSVTPKTIDFVNVTNGTTKMDSVTVSNQGTADLNIFGVTSANVFYSIEPSFAVIRSGLSRKFFITFAPLTPGSQSGFIYFNNNVINVKDSIFVTGIGVGNTVAPIFRINTSNLDFGNVSVGSSKQKSVYVTNTGASNLIISDITSSNVQYAITPVIGTIAPNTTQEFFITFAPIAIGQVNAAVLFTHNVGKDILNVTGNGVDSVRAITIKEARDLPVGTDVVVEGIVTRTLGSYTRIQDVTGGLTLFHESGVLFDEVQNSEIAMGDKLRIQGRISEKDFLKIITNDDIISHQRISRLNTLPTPAVVTLVELALNGEKYESCLIKVENITMDADSDIAFRELKIYEITDTTDKTNTVVVSIGKNTDTHIVGMPIYNKVATFEGILSQATSKNICGYQLLPVLPSDLRFSATGISTPIAGNQLSLSNNYPNPFNSSTTIQYTIEHGDVVSLKVFTMLGKEVATLVAGYQNAGTHAATFTADETTSIGSEVYFYRLEVGTSVSAKQMMLVK
jgi:hypothetical protein